MPRDAHQGAEALIHLRVPAAVKGRWIRASRAAGMRLTDWIVRAVETRMEQQIALITIPEDVSFADLQYRREPDGSVSFSWEPIERICEASGLDARMFSDAPEDVVAGLIVQWYRAHLASGGARDANMDDLIAEAAIEDSHGQHVSHAPGRA